jgi:hypothetical protein
MVATVTELSDSIIQLRGKPSQVKKRQRPKLQKFKAVRNIT